MKILFITYYWPPAGGVSVQRILQFVTHLDKLGVECHVIHPANPSYYMEDTNLNKLIGSSIYCHPVNIFDITKLIKLLPSQGKEGNIKDQKQGGSSGVLKRIRANWFIPDPKVNWVPKIVKKASVLHEQQNFDLIFTNGTPHSVHLAGLQLKEKFQVPWIADFRDPWTKMDYFEHLPLSKKSREKHFALEKKVISNADITLTVSESWKNDFNKAGAKRAEYITNGFDEYIQNKDSDGFIIGHVGSLHSDRSLDLICAALQNINKTNPSLSEKTKLVLVGNIDASIAKKLKGKLPQKQIQLVGIVTHAEAKTWIGKSNILLLPINNSKASYGRIPAKLFEYLSAQKPVALLGKPEGDAAKIILDNGFGKSFDESQVLELEKFIVTIAEQELKSYYSKDKIEKYSRENLALELLKLMKGLL